MAVDSSGSWLEVSVEASTEAVDAIVEVLRARGVSGVAIEPAIVTHADEGFALTSEPCLVRAYLPMGPDTSQRVQALDEALWHLRAFDLAPLSDLTTRVVAEEDWANAWKEHFHPFRVGSRLLIKPSWRDIESKDDEIILELDPGMAFGTGLHPTTQMVLEALETLIRPNMRVFDIGTGSGILSVAAAKLGASHVLAVDTDEVAVRVTNENSALNGVDGRIAVHHGSVEAGDGTYDIVLANIIASVIAAMASELAARVSPEGGILVASGIIEERLPLVESAFSGASLAIVETHRSGDWVCLVAQRHASRSTGSHVPKNKGILRS